MEEVPTNPQAIIAGYGLPGRSAAAALASQHVSFCIIELNPATVSRCSLGGTPIIKGSCTDPAVLREAGILTAKLLLIAIPDDAAVLETITSARQLNPDLRIIARCTYTSGGIEARARGADEVIVAEQLTADEVARRLQSFPAE